MRSPLKLMVVLATFVSLLTYHARAQTIDDYLEPTTILVGQVDMGIDLPNTFRIVQSKFPQVLPEEQRATIQFMAGPILASLRAADIQRLYVTMSLMDLHTGHVALIASTTNAAEASKALQTLVDLLPASLGYSVFQAEHAVVVTNESIWQRLKAKPKAKREELSSALSATQDYTLSLHVNIREELRATVARMLPQSIPSSSLALSPQGLMSDVQTWQVMLQLPVRKLAGQPRATQPPELKVSMNCSDPAAAARTADWANQSLAQASLEAIRFETHERECLTRLDMEKIEHLAGVITRQIAEQNILEHQSHNLSTIQQAMYGFYAKYGYSPPRKSIDAAQRPLLSWRVFLLPFLGQEDLYRQFKLDEPWDSPHNQPLIAKMPAVYQDVRQRQLPAGHTLIVMPLAKGNVFAGEELIEPASREFRGNIDGGEAITLVVAPPEKSVVWTKPDDLPLNEAKLFEGLFGAEPRLQAVFYDGHVELFEPAKDEARIRELFLGK